MTLAIHRASVLASLGRCHPSASVHDRRLLSLFRIEDGVCVEGPCEGDKLFPAAVTVAGDAVVYTRDGVELVDEISRIVSTTD